MGPSAGAGAAPRGDGATFASAEFTMSLAMRSVTSSSLTIFPLRRTLNTAVSDGRMKKVCSRSCVLSDTFWEFISTISSPTMKPAFFAGAFSATNSTTTFAPLAGSRTSLASIPNQL